MSVEAETWAKTSLSSDYEVSSHGRVASLFYRGKQGRFRRNTPKILKPMNGTNGYLRVCIRTDNKKAYPSIHRLVACAFVIGDQRLDVAHIDGNRHNNCASNLRWSTQSENEADKLKHGTALTGNKCKFFKYSFDVVQKIREMRDHGMKVCDISREMEMSYDTVYYISRNKTGRTA